MSTAQPNGAATLSVPLDPDTANTIVEAVAFELTSIGESLERLLVSTTPGDLVKVETVCKRIGRLAAINDQLQWRAHHGGYMSAQEREALDQSIVADEATLLDVASVLRYHADGFMRSDDPDEAKEAPRYAQASRVIARAVGEA